VKIISWNVNGIRAAQRKGFIDWLKEENPEVCCLQETKARRNQLDSKLLNIHGYKSYFESSKVKKGYSGVAIYTRIKPKKIVKGIGISKFDQEGRVISADFGNFILINVYFPNGKASDIRLKYKLEFYDAFYYHVENLLKSKKQIIICGDVNTAHKEIDLAHPKPNAKFSGFLPIERKWISKLLRNNFVDSFRFFHPSKINQYTWWSMRLKARERNVGWRIDYIFVDKKLLGNLKDAFILSEVMGSDHCPVGIDLKFVQKRRK